MNENEEIANILSVIKSALSSKATTGDNLTLQSLRKTISLFENVVETRKAVLHDIYAFSKSWCKKNEGLQKTGQHFADSFQKYAEIFDDVNINHALHLLPDVMRENCSNQLQISNSLKSSIQIPLKTLLKTDIKYLAELKRIFDDSVKDYKNKSSKLDKDSKKKNADNIKFTDISDFERHRMKIFSVFCDYLLKYQEIRDKTSVGFINNCISHIRTLTSVSDHNINKIKFLENLFKDYEKNVDNFHKIENKEFTIKIYDIKNELSVYFGHEVLQVVKSDRPRISFGDKTILTSKDGYVSQKTEGLRKVWKRKFLSVKNGILEVKDSPLQPSKLSLPMLTSEIKTHSEKDSKLFAFTIISFNRRYYFATDNEIETNSWIDVLTNARSQMLTATMASPIPNRKLDSSQYKIDNIFKIMKPYIMSIPGNDKCADCSAENPDWVSCNLGVVVCIECSGIHREMGVNVSRIRSLAIDNLKVAEILIPAATGNYMINCILDPNSESGTTLISSSSMENRKIFIYDKYKHLKFLESINEETLLDMNLNVMLDLDIGSIFYLYFSGFDFTKKYPPLNDTFLHFLCRNSNETDLVKFEFIVQNIHGLVNIKNDEGNTALHIALENKLFNVVRILLKALALTNTRNSADLAAIDFINNREICDKKDIINAVQKAQVHSLDIDPEIIPKQSDFSIAFESNVDNETNLTTKISSSNANKNIILKNMIESKSPLPQKLFEESSENAEKLESLSNSSSNSSINQSNKSSIQGYPHQNNDCPKKSVADVITLNSHDSSD